ncbi:GGDEF domain-containing protein, partial [Kiloniella majae]
EITLPSGSWTLSLSHDISNNLATRTLNMIAISLLLSSICALMLYNILVRPLALQKEVAEKTQELKELAFKDPLTGLPNRRYLNDHLSDI